MDFRKLKDHLVICGWKDHMQDILREILALNPQYNASDIAVVSNVDESVVEQIKDQKELKALRFVHGDYWSEGTLQRANVAQARKVLVLADTLESTAASEVDSKTVMAVLTTSGLTMDQSLAELWWTLPADAWNRFAGMPTVGSQTKLSS